MHFSFLTHLECPRCHTRYSADETIQLCTCGSPVLARYDLDAVREQLDRQTLQTREPSLWRYHELLPVRSPEHIVSLGEGMTPLTPLKKLGEQVGITQLFVKDEGVIPTGSFKARGAAVGVSRARELGVRALALPTNGNAGGAWAAYAARAGIEAVILMPEAAPLVTRYECSLSGATLFLVDGLISDAGAIVERAVKAHHYYNASTLKEPYRIEGKKTMGYEILEQFQWEVPDVILYPTGGGVGIIGIYKALREMQQLGWIGARLPRLVAVQAEGCAPIVQAWQQGESTSQFWRNSSTVAFGMNVPKALGDFLVLEAVNETNGCAIAVSDEAILQAQRELASLEGLFACPEGAATFAAARQLRDNGWINEKERVVLLNTGAGIKYPPTTPTAIPTLQPWENIPVPG